jgi:DNA-binding PucR family transcriptional regulator
VLLPAARVHDTVPHLDVRTLTVPGDAVDMAVAEATDVLLVPDAVRTRPALLRTLEGRGALVGPARTWRRVVESLALALRAHRLLAPADGEVVDTEQHRDALVVGADPGALGDLRSAVLAPLEGLKPAAAQRLAATLQAWLLHLGRRGEVADALHVHPQTVRYRMDQVRELYGDRLEDPAMVQQLVIALAVEAVSAREAS